MADIQLQKINEVYTRVTAEPGIEKELSEFFKFRPPNYQFQPLARNKAARWEGWIKLYNLRTKYLYAGLLKYLLDFARDRGYTVEHNSDLFLMNNFSRIEAREFIKSLNLQSRNADLAAREYQEIGLAKAVRYKRLTMISPTRSGKSLILYSFVRYLLDTRKGSLGLLVVPTTSLVEQMYTDFQDYSTANLWDVESRVQRLYDGYTDEIQPGTKLLVSTWQSLFRMPDTFFHKFDFLIGDEAHTFSATQVGNVAGRAINAEYRLACTGTTHEEDVNNLKVEGYFGPISKLTTTKKLMDDGHIAKLSIKSLVLKYPPLTQLTVDSMYPPMATGAQKFAVELDFLINCAPRNKFLRNLALSVEGNTLLMFHYERHGLIIYDLIKSKLVDSERKLFFVNGKTETEVREEVRKITDGEKNAIIVGSFVFSTGITIRNLHNVIFGTPTKAKIRTLQTIGRSLGLGDDKTTATLYDIADDFRVTPQDEPNYTLNHYMARMALYHAEQFEISHYSIQLRN